LSGKRLRQQLVDDSLEEFLVPFVQAIGKTDRHTMRQLMLESPSG
jgi:hypothetical protein